MTKISKQKVVWLESGKKRGVIVTACFGREKFVIKYVGTYGGSFQFKISLLTRIDMCIYMKYSHMFIHIFVLLLYNIMYSEHSAWEFGRVRRLSLLLCTVCSKLVAVKQ